MKQPNSHQGDLLKHWLVIHSLEAYAQHPDMIGCKPKEPKSRQPADGRFDDIRRGDKIVYYARGDKVIVGIFEVVSDYPPEYLEADPQWGEELVYRIEPDLLPPKGRYLDFDALMKDPSLKFDLFPDKRGERWRYQIWGHTCRPMTKNDFELIHKQIQRLRIEPEKAVAVTPGEKIGAPLGGDLLFEPTDETGVVCLFSKYHKKLGFPFIKRIRSAFPDAEVLDDKGEPKFVEFEFNSSSYKAHGHDRDPKRCDFLVCWTHDWSDMPPALEDSLEIIPLQEALADILGR